MFSVNAAIEFVAFVCALLFVVRGGRRPLMYVAVFLGYTFINEAVANYWYQELGKPRNYPFYNIYAPLSLLFYGWFVRLGIRSRLRRRVCEAAMIAGGLFSAANAGWGQGAGTYHTYSFIVIMMLMLTIVLVRFYDLVASDTARLSTPAEPYLLAGLLVFNCCGLVTMALHPTMRASGIEWRGYGLYNMMFWGINALQYGLFILGFWKCRTNNNNTG